MNIKHLTILRTVEMFAQDALEQVFNNTDGGYISSFLPIRASLACNIRHRCPYVTRNLRVAFIIRPQASVPTCFPSALLFNIPVLFNIVLYSNISVCVRDPHLISNLISRFFFFFQSLTEYLFITLPSVYQYLVMYFSCIGDT